LAIFAIGCAVGSFGSFSSKEPGNIVTQQGSVKRGIQRGNPAGGIPESSPGKPFVGEGHQVFMYATKSTDWRSLFPCVGVHTGLSWKFSGALHAATAGPG
jgi:hypothetical protein